MGHAQANKEPAYQAGFYLFLQKDSSLLALQGLFRVSLRVEHIIFDRKRRCISAPRSLGAAIA